jgi:hypothetical protein
LSDFEKAVLNTMEKAFPSANVRGCNFHHKQAIRRNIQTKGLQVLLNNSTKFMYFVKMLYGLSFVPPDKVTEIFDNTIISIWTTTRTRRASLRWRSRLKTLWPTFSVPGLA